MNAYAAIPACAAFLTSGFSVIPRVPGSLHVHAEAEPEALPDAGHVSHVATAQPDSGAVREVIPVERFTHARKEKKI